MKQCAICLSLYGKTDEIIDAIRSNAADLYEIRIDFSPGVDAAAVRAATQNPLIFTAHEQPHLLEPIAAYANYLDAGSARLTPGQFRQIISYHGEETYPGPLLAVTGSNLTKIVLKTENYSNILHLIELNRRPNMLTFAMGEVGRFSRILSVFQGGPWIYAALPGRETADGQFSLPELTEIYRLRRFTSVPVVFGIIGNPVAHSRSPEFHNERLAREKKPWIYLPFFCKNLKSLLELAPRFGIRGFSLTHPFKEEVIPLLFAHSEDVRSLKACNTVFYGNGFWEGINTDVQGARAVLSKIGESVRESRVLLLGAGGAAKAMARVLAGSVKEWTVLNRTTSKATAIAKQFGGKSGGLSDFAEHDYDVLIQATSIGLRAGESPIDPVQLKPGKIVIDLIYHPSETTLLRKARELGCNTFNGDTWFDAQAEAQFRWWSSRMGS